MSAKNNVNKDHYTQAGRGQTNENIVHDDQKQAMTRAEKRIATGEAALPRGKRQKSRSENPPMVIGADEARVPPTTEPAADNQDREVGGER